MLDNNAVTTFVLALHNKAVGCLTPNNDVDFSEYEGGSRSRVVVRSGDSEMVTYYDGFSQSIPYRTVLKHDDAIVFSHFYGKAPRKNKISESQTAAMTSTLANPGNSHCVSRSLVCLS